MPETTLDDIAEAVGDIKKNAATKTEVLTLIDKKIEEDKEKAKAETQTLYDKAVQDMEDIHKANVAMAQQIKLLQSTRFASIKTPDGMYNGCWGDLETAKNFGLLVLAEVGKRKEAGEMLDALGIDRKRIVGDEVKAMGEDVGTTGGILVPTEFIPNLIMLIEKYGVYRRNVLEYPMASDSAIAPKLTRA